MPKILFNKSIKKQLSYFLVLFTFSLSYSQDFFLGTVVDEDVKTPISNVDVYNNENFEITNTEGRFLINWGKDTLLNIKILGYEYKSIHKKDIKNDTIYLKKTFIELEEIVLTSGNILLKNIEKNATSNYPIKSFSEFFFLRGLARKNNKIKKLIDINGIVSRKKNLITSSKDQLPKHNFSVKILNLRKSEAFGINTTKFPSFYDLLFQFSNISTNSKVFNFTEISISDNYVKIIYTPKNNTIKYNGYFIVNTTNYAIEEFHLSQNQGYEYVLNSSKNEEKENEYLDKQIEYELNLNFKKNSINKKYYLDKATVNATIESTSNKGSIDIYAYEFFWYGTKRAKKSIKSNINVSNNIFNTNKPYSESFWKNQNKLLLTTEMKKFIESLNSKDDNDFK